MAQNKTIITKKKHFPVTVNLDTGQIGCPLSELVRMWAIQNGVSEMDVYVNEASDWDVAPMRRFLHAVIIPAFVAKYTEAMNISNDRTTRETVKRFLKAKFLGYIMDKRYVTWENILSLRERPVDLLDWINLEKVLSHVKDPPEVQHTEDLTAERYWPFINNCEHLYFSEFQDMYSLREKPKKPENSD